MKLDIKMVCVSNEKNEYIKGNIFLNDEKNNKRKKE